MARIKNTNVYIFDTVPEASSFLVGSDQGDGRITKSYRIDTVFGLLPSYGYFTDAPSDGQPYLRQDNTWVTVPPSGVGSVFSVFGRTGAVTGQEADYDSFYSLLGHTHLEADITDLQAYLLPSDIGTTVQAYDIDLDNVSGTNTGDQSSIVGITGTKAQFNTSLTGGNFMFVGDAPTSHTHVEADITDLQDYLLSADIDTLAKLNAILTGNTLIDTNDARLSDARTPLTHTHVEADITDLQTYLTSVDISDINTTGTASASTWLRGDGTWGTILGGVSSVFGRTAAILALEEDYDDFYSLLGHTHVEADITDLQAYLLSVDIADINTTGTASSSTFLRGDGSWQVVSTSTDWGDLGGTLADQTDLQSALDGKANSSHTHVIANITGLQSALNGKLSTSGGSITGNLGVKSLQSDWVQTGGNQSNANTVFSDYNVPARGLLVTSNSTSSTNYASGFGQTLFINGGSDGRNMAIYKHFGGNNDYSLGNSESGAWNWRKIWTDGNDGAGSGLDADTVDGLQASQFLRKDVSDTMTGNLTVTGTITAEGRITGEGSIPFDSIGTGLMSNNTTQNYWVARDSANTPLWYIGTASTSNNDVVIFNYDGNAFLRIKDGGEENGLEYYDGSTTRTVWHSGNQPITTTPTANTVARRDYAGRLKAVELEINTLRLYDSSDRPGLLQTRPLTAEPYAGFQIRDNPSNQYWSFMGDDNNVGVFDDTNTKWVWLHYENGGTEFHHNGNVRLTTTNAGITITGTATATNFILSSDERLKENIQDLDIPHIPTAWKSFTMGEDKQIRYGVIAQELEETNPEFVRTDDDGMKSVAYIDLLVAKCAEQDKRIEMLESKLELIIKELM